MSHLEHSASRNPILPQHLAHQTIEDSQHWHWNHPQSLSERQNSEYYLKSIAIVHTWSQFQNHHPMMLGNIRTTWKISKHKWRSSTSTRERNRHETKHPQSTATIVQISQCPLLAGNHHRSRISGPLRTSQNILASLIATFQWRNPHHNHTLQTQQANLPNEIGLGYFASFLSTHAIEWIQAGGSHH